MSWYHNHAFALSSNISSGSGSLDQDVKNAFETFSNASLSLESSSSVFSQVGTEATIRYTGVPTVNVRIRCLSLWKIANVLAFPLSVAVYKNSSEVSGHVQGVSLAAIADFCPFNTDGVVSLSTNDTLSIRIAVDNASDVSVSCFKLNFSVKVL